MALRLLTFSHLLLSVLGLSTKFLACQVQKIENVSPLTDCPPGTIYVSQDPNDGFAHFHRIQDALESLPNNTSEVILVGAGEYHETINITRQGPITLIGQLPASAALSPNSPFYSDPPFPNNLVQVWDDKFVQNGIDDAQSAVLLVAPSFDASLIGAGPTGAPLQPVFGTTDFKAYNIDFQNRAADFAISQALVTDVSYANASFYGCSFASFQDTWYTGRNGSTYVADSVIYGQTDYLFGFGTAWFEKVVLANRACGGGIVAWKGTNLTDAPDNRYGAYIANSRIIRSPDANETTVTDQRCFLGRPWNDLATTVFLDTFMDNTIRPAGWTPFDSARPVIANTTFYAEFNSTGQSVPDTMIFELNTASKGPGGNISQRVPVEHFLSEEEARNYTVDAVFLGQPEWIDVEYRF